MFQIGYYMFKLSPLLRVYSIYLVDSTQTWNNAQACKQCLCKFLVFCVIFLNVPAYSIENAQKVLCKAKFAKFACVYEKQYSMSGLEVSRLMIFTLLHKIHVHLQ